MASLTTPDWEEPSEHPELKDDIHAWLIPLEKANCLPSSLSAGELERWRQMSDPVFGRRFCAARSALRLLLGNYTGTAAAQIRLQVSAHGKPHLVDPADSIRFNLSHSADWALMAFSRSLELGADLERLRDLPSRRRIARRTMGARAISELEANNYSDLDFTRLWTCLEARQKCQGQGIFGRSVKETETGLVSFRVAEQIIGSIAWAEPDIRPGIRYFRSLLMKTPP